jgi:hypothetical protein
MTAIASIDYGVAGGSHTAARLLATLWESTTQVE